MPLESGKGEKKPPGRKGSVKETIDSGDRESLNLET
jgi:hypothetical protein